MMETSAKSFESVILSLSRSVGPYALRVTELILRQAQDDEALIFSAIAGERLPYQHRYCHSFHFPLNLDAFHVVPCPEIWRHLGRQSRAHPQRRQPRRRVAHRPGTSLVVVVSAMSGVTDSLIKLAREVNPEADRARSRRASFHRRAADHRADSPWRCTASASRPFR